MPAHSLTRLLWGAYLFLWIGGVASHATSGGTPSNMAWAAPVFLALAAAIAVVSEWPEWRPMALAFAIGFAAEAAGVHWAYPFGSYRYSGVLAPLIFGVPPVVAGAWMILFAYVRQMRLGIIASAAAMAALDLVIDPLAANVLGFWHWQSAGPVYGVPLTNFAGWFMVSAGLFAVTRGEARRNSQMVWLGTSILLFFAAIAAVHSYFLPAALGTVLATVGYFRSMPSKV
ncbi:MAG: carotenoid biosynthesis protein [Acidobacteriota bacterium]|nr:carotenoid biosynthesis protein [Acidobacteriota bacterium]